MSNSPSNRTWLEDLGGAPAAAVPQPPYTPSHNRGFIRSPLPPGNFPDGFGTTVPFIRANEAAAAAVGPAANGARAPAANGARSHAAIGARSSTAAVSSENSMIPQGIEIVQKAIVADGEGDYEKALSLYRDALQRFALGLKYEKNAARKKLILDRTQGYMDRVEELADYVKKQNELRSRAPDGARARSHAANGARARTPTAPSATNPRRYPSSSRSADRASAPPAAVARNSNSSGLRAHDSPTAPSGFAAAGQCQFSHDASPPHEWKRRHPARFTFLPKPKQLQRLHDHAELLLVT